MRTSTRRKSSKHNPYAGPATCLRCDARFQSWDRRQNRLCQRCRKVLAEFPSDDFLTLRYRKACHKTIDDA
jgi:hypothetical protein